MVDHRSIQKIDFFRNFFTGGLIPILEVILMLLFIKSFQAGTWEKTALIVAIKSSYILGMPLSLWVFRKHFPINQAIFLVCVVAGISLWVSTLVGTVWGFLILVSLAALPWNGLHGLLSEFYNYYPREIRGKLYVTSNFALFVGGILFALFYDYILGKEHILNRVTAGSEGNEEYTWVLAVGTIAVVIAGYFARLFPKITFTGLDKPSLKGWLNILREDRLFLYVLVAWFLLGIANLWIVSYRTNLLVEEEFGFRYDETRVLLLIILVPQISYLLFNYPFAYLFDRYNIIILRILINVCMGLYIGFFFMSTSFYGQLIGAFFYGVFTSGGNLAWKLWVYKVVPSEKVSSYMNIHTAFTGLRMIISPVFGLIGLYNLGPKNSAWISLAFLSISTIMIFFLIPIARKKFIY